MKPNEVLTKELTQLQKELIAAYNQKGMKSSGEWEEGLEVQVYSSSDGLTGILKGLNYSQQLETGRKPGRFPPRDEIEKWIKEKGLAANIEGEISVSSLAFLIARKISREGWNRQGYGGVNLISDVVTPQRIQNIINLVGDSYVVAVTTDIVKSFQEINLN